MERREEEEVCELSERVQETLREELKMKKSEITMDDITTWLEGQYITTELLCRAIDSRCCYTSLAIYRVKEEGCSGLQLTSYHHSVS